MLFYKFVKCSTMFETNVFTASAPMDAPIKLICALAVLTNVSVSRMGDWSGM